MLNRSRVCVSLIGVSVMMIMLMAMRVIMPVLVMMPMAVDVLMVMAVGVRMVMAVCVRMAVLVPAYVTGTDRMDVHIFRQIIPDEHVGL
jgi:hypothetical protein